LARGTDVLSSDGEKVGTVVHVLAAEQEDVFDGIIISEGLLASNRFVDADQIEAMYERGVILKLDAQAAANLPEPSANPGVVSDDPAQAGLQDKLRRAWDWISGNY
jgi:uncharacterized protein YrrD